MKKVDRWAALTAALLLTVSLASASQAAEAGEKIVILHTNDVHCALDDAIGYAGLAAYAGALEEQYLSLIHIFSRLQVRPALQHLQKDGLGHVLRVLPGARAAPRQPEHRVSIPLKELPRIQWVSPFPSFFSLPVKRPAAPICHICFCRASFF